MKTISLIAAISENFVIGAENKLLWSMPADQAYYKNTIENKPIIMGRKTAASEDMFFSSEQNILITRETNYSKEGFEVVNSLREAIEITKKDDIFITGGEQIYRMALPKAHYLYLTRIHTTVEGDAHFPQFAEQNWQLEWEEKHKADADNPYDYTFQRYKLLKAF